MNRIIVKVIEGIKRIFRKPVTPTNKAIVTPIPETVLEQTVIEPMPKKSYYNIETKRRYNKNNRDTVNTYANQWYHKNKVRINANRKLKYHMNKVKVGEK